MIAVNPTKIKISREKKGLSQEYMASVLDVSQPAYARMENGKQRIEGAQLYKIAQELGEQMEAFINEGPHIHQQENEFKDHSINSAYAYNQNIYCTQKELYEEQIKLLREEITEMRKERRELIALLKGKG
jgi:XRE family transcriptional regulator, regulator of sulfur utilization